MEGGGPGRLQVTTTKFLGGNEENHGPLSRFQTCRMQSRSGNPSAATFGCFQQTDVQTLKCTGQAHAHFQSLSTPPNIMEQSHFSQASSTLAGRKIYYLFYGKRRFITLCKSVCQWTLLRASLVQFMASHTPLIKYGFPSTLRFSKCFSSSQDLYTAFFTHFTFLLLDALPIPLISVIWSSYCYIVKNTNYLTPQYVTFFSLLPLQSF